MNEINRNTSGHDNWSDNSFIGQLHERNYWSDAEFSKLELALNEIAEKLATETKLPRRLVMQTTGILSHVMLLITSHFDPNDGYEIDNSTNDEVIMRRDAMLIVFESFFSGTT